MITEIRITRRESPTFGGVSFGAVGPYEKLVGRAWGEVDPQDPRNAVITDLALAPRNIKGRVEYATDVYILRPVDSALDQWVSEAKEPPRNQVPRVADGTLVPALPQDGVGFPTIPGVTYNGCLHEGDLFDFGPAFDHGILTVLPPVCLGAPYPVFVPKTDGDGNDIAGGRLVEIAVPLATYTGWGLRAGPAAGDGCDAWGQKIDFPQTQAERLATGDSRRSIAERYVSHAHYVQEITKAAKALERQRFLLDEDVQRYIPEAEASSIGKEWQIWAHATRVKAPVALRALDAREALEVSDSPDADAEPMHHTVTRLFYLHHLPESRV